MLKSAIEDNIEENWEILCYSSVLHLRGEEISKQPFIDSNWTILQYNGEIFRIEEGKVDSEETEDELIGNRI